MRATKYSLNDPAGNDSEQHYREATGDSLAHVRPTYKHKEILTGEMDLLVIPVHVTVPDYNSNNTKNLRTIRVRSNTWAS